jgi:hypothetical protein
MRILSQLAAGTEPTSIVAPFFYVVAAVIIVLIVISMLRGK